jgi:lysophospholipase L1-like esterase
MVKRMSGLFAAMALVFGVISAATLITLPARQVSAAAEATDCAPATKATSRKIAVMGDSIATTYGASTPERSWPELLKAQGATHGWAVTLHGVGSSMASQYLPGQQLFWVTQQVRSAHPDLVTLDFRANEHLKGQTPAQLKASLLALMDAIREVSPNTQFLIFNPPVLWYHGFYTTPATQADYAAKMREAADERNACWLDLTPLFPSGSGPDAWTRTFLFDDIHPGDVGHRAFYAAIYTAMLQHCG